MNDQPIVFLEHPILTLPKKHFQKVDTGYRPTALFDKEGHKHDVTILDIDYCEEEMQSDFTIQGAFSQEKYQSALLLKLGSYPRSVQRDFLKYQIAALDNPREWLQTLEQLVESYTRVSVAVAEVTTRGRSNETMDDKV